MSSDGDRLSLRARVLCTLGALITIPLGLISGFLMDPPLDWYARAPLILLVVVGGGLLYLAVSGKRSAFIETLVELSWFPF